MKQVNIRFEQVKYKLWQFILTNYRERYTSAQFAEELQEPIELIEMALNKLQQEERVDCNNNYWSIRWPLDSEEYGHTVGEFVIIEWCLHLIKLVKEGKIKKNTIQYEEAKKVYNVLKKFLQWEDE